MSTPSRSRACTRMSQPLRGAPLKRSTQPAAPVVATRTTPRAAGSGKRAADQRVGWGCVCVVCACMRECATHIHMHRIIAAALLQDLLSASTAACAACRALLSCERGDGQDDVVCGQDRACSVHGPCCPALSMCCQAARRWRSQAQRQEHGRNSAQTCT
jgi:hypothetical protein